MIIPMKKISIRGPRTELKNIIDVLKSSGAFEMSNLKKINADAVGAPHKEELEHSLARIQTVLEFIKTSLKELSSVLNDIKVKKQAKTSVTVLNAVHEIEYAELKDMADAEARVFEVVNTIEAAATKHSEINAAIKRNTSVITELAPYYKLDIAFNTLVDTEHTFVLTGIIDSANFEQFKSDYDLSHIKHVQYQSTGTNIVVVLIGHKDDYVIAREIFSYGFERCKLNYNIKALEKIKEYEELKKDLVVQKTANLSKCLIAPEDLMLLKTYYDYLSNELDTEEISDYTLQGESFFVISGWIVGREEAHIITLLKKTSPQVSFNISAPSASDIPPAMIKNNSIVAPYGSITNLYSAPGPRDIDPNMFVAFFYFIFFGVMIGDIGYGIIMSILALTVILFLKPKKKGTRDLILIIGMCGISTIIWGLVFGSFFGATTSEGLLGKIFPSGIINPIENAMVFLVLCLGLGVVHIIFGVFLKFYNLLRQRKYIDAITTAFSRLMLFVGIGIFAFCFLVDDLVWLNTTGIGIITASLALIVIGGARNKKGIPGKLSGGFGALYSLVNYFSDILSYARLFGLGLVGAVIASVANTMGGMLFAIPIIGIPLAILVAAIFHAVNLAIGLLSAYVHNARLQFIEFFSKFYQGGGKQFVPMGSGLKYTKIKEVRV